MHTDEKAALTRQEEGHRQLRQLWARIKHDPSLRIQTEDPHGCSACRKPVEEPLRVCSACKMVVYCSPECAKRDWFGHKPLYEGHKRDGEILSRWKAILEQFPWTARGYVSSGAYHNSVVLIQFGLLGTDRKKVGYWVETVKNLDALMGEEVHKAPWTSLSEQEGWRLPKEQIPSLERLHEPNAHLPSFPPTFDDSWRSYYQWRGLPMTSPAALLLHWPLTVYACLKAAGIMPIYQPGPRRKLTIFYVGAQDEITFIPVFGELALLFPNTDLDMVMFGPTVRKSVAGAITRGDIKPSARYCVFKYTSPASCGSGTIRVLLDAKDADYVPSRNPSENPDVIVALNAGLGTYPSWQDVIYLAAELSIPFVVTDYSEAGVLVVRLTEMEQALKGTLPRAKNVKQEGFYMR